MSCSRGCHPTFADHVRSLHISSSSRGDLTKTTTDDHGTHQVDVVEHWHDQQDVTVRPNTIRRKMIDPDQE